MNNRVKALVKELIKRLKETEGLSLDDFANSVDQSTWTIKKWEREGNIPDKKLNALCELYGVDRNWLETGVGDMFISGKPVINKEVTTNNIQTRLKTARKTLKLTQEQLGEKIGVTGASVTGWESKGVIPESQRERICKELGINRQWLETGEGEMFNKEPEPLALEAAAKSSAEKKVPTPKETPREFAKRHGCNDVTAMVFENFLSLPEEEQEEFVKLIYRFARESRAKE